MMKKSRQDKILELVAAYYIDTQDELIDRLRESGYDVTQATVSRDIRALNLIKVQTEQGKYRYVRTRPTIKRAVTIRQITHIPSRTFVMR